MHPSTVVSTKFYIIFFYLHCFDVVAYISSQLNQNKKVFSSATDTLEFLASGGSRGKRHGPGTSELAS